MTTTRLLILASLSALFSAPTIFAQSESSDRIDTKPLVGEIAPDFELPPLRFYDFKIDQREITRENAAVLYDPVRLSDFRGVKAVVLMFGGGATPDGRLAEFQRLHETYKDRLQFLFVYAATISADVPTPSELERMQSANTFVAERKITIPCLVDTGAAGPTQAYSSVEAPVFLIDQSGRITHIGSHDAESTDLERAIRAEITRITDL